MPIKVCFHNHSILSKFSVNIVSDYKRVLENGKLDKLAVTDHNEIDYALYSQKKLGKEKIIVGEEITTTQGEIIGLFLHKKIDRRQDPVRTCELIKEQNGLVFLPHPLSEKGVGIKVMEKIKPFIDMVEIYNGWEYLDSFLSFRYKNILEETRQWALKNAVPGVSATDCHYPLNLGNCYTVMDSFNSAGELLTALKNKRKYVSAKNKFGYHTFLAYLKGIYHIAGIKF